VEPRLLGTVLILLFSALHAANVRAGAWVQNTAVLFKVILILGFVGFAAGRLGATHLPPPQSAPLALMGVSLVWVSFSYSGWNAAIYIGGEISNPERNLPRSLMLGTAIVTLIYLALNAVFVFSAPIAQLAGKLEVGRVAATALGGPAWGNMVSALVALVLVSSISSLIMARRRLFARLPGRPERTTGQCHSPARGAGLNLVVVIHLRPTPDLHRLHPGTQHCRHSGRPYPHPSARGIANLRARLALGAWLVPTRDPGDNWVCHCPAPKGEPGGSGDHPPGLPRLGLRRISPEILRAQAPRAVGLMAVSGAPRPRNSSR